MKRIGITLAVALLLVLALIVLFFRPIKDPNAPRYVPVQAQPAGPFVYEQYDWGGSVPIRDGKFWLWVQARWTNRQILNYLYDLDQGRAVGEFLHGAPVF